MVSSIKGKKKGEKRSPLELLEAERSKYDSHLKKIRWRIKKMKKEEEKKLAAFLLKEIKLIIDDLPEPKPTIEVFPTLIKEWLEISKTAKGLCEVIEGNPAPTEISNIFASWIVEMKANKTMFKRSLFSKVNSVEESDNIEKTNKKAVSRRNNKLKDESKTKIVKKKKKPVENSALNLMPKSITSLDNTISDTMDNSNFDKKINSKDITLENRVLNINLDTNLEKKSNLLSDTDLTPANAELTPTQQELLNQSVEPVNQSLHHFDNNAHNVNQDNFNQEDKQENTKQEVASIDVPVEIKQNNFEQNISVAESNQVQIPKSLPESSPNMQPIETKDFQ